MKNSWIKIKDRHPESSLQKLLIVLEGYGRIVEEARYITFYQEETPTFWLTENDRKVSEQWEGWEITHWQPIELPEE